MKKSILTTVTEKVMQDTIYMNAHDGQPFSVVEDSGFKKLAQTLVDTGFKKLAQCGIVDVDDLFYGRTSLSKTHLPNVYSQKVDKFKILLTSIDYAAITTDIRQMIWLKTIKRLVFII